MNLKHDKENVIKVGLGLFCKKGYSSLGIDEICKTTGMTKGAFYHSFKSKEQFLIETVRLYGANNVKRIQNELNTNVEITALERLQNFYTKMFEAQPKNQFIGCFINNIMSELGAVNPIIGKLSSIEFDKFIDAIEPTVKAAQAEGSLKNDIDSRSITELLHATFYGLLTKAKSNQDYQQSINTFNLLLANLK